MKRTAIILLAVLVVTLAGGGAWYYSSQRDGGLAPNRSEDSRPKPDNSPVSPADDTSKPSGTDGTPDKQTYQVSVYFSKHPQSDGDPSVVYPVDRTSPDLGVATFAIKELLKGPTTGEIANGYFSTAQLRDGTGTDDFKLTIDNDTATLQFLRQFDHRGVVADGQAESILKATLRQFPSVKKVVILNSSGNCEFDLSGLNKCLE